MENKKLIMILVSLVLIVIVLFFLIEYFMPRDMCYEMKAKDYCRNYRRGYDNGVKLFIEETPYKFRCRTDDGRSSMTSYSVNHYFLEREVNDCENKFITLIIGSRKSGEGE